MDSITHGLVAFLLFHSSFPVPAVLFSVLGAVLPDSDILLKRVSDRDPELFVFSHGGFTHSIAGALVIATGIMLGFLFWHIPGGHGPFVASQLAAAWIFSFAGALTHIALDALAFPGIPFLYPATTRKYSAGIFPGPSLVLFAASIAFLLLLLAGSISIGAIVLYAVFGMIVIVAHAILKASIALRNEGLTIPTFNPAKWLVVTEREDSFEVYYTGLFNRSAGSRVYMRRDGVDPESLNRHSHDPEFRRLVYYSYITIARREGDSFVVRDPLREDGFLFYPPSYTRVYLDGAQVKEHGRARSAC